MDNPLFEYKRPLPVGVARRTCLVCGRQLELIAYAKDDLDALDYNLAVLAERHERAHEAVDAGDKPYLSKASWKGASPP